MHHMTANWCPIGREERNQLCYGVWGTVGSTGRWPEVVNMWELDGWDGLAANFEHELSHPSMQDPSLAEWWAAAAEPAPRRVRPHPRTGAVGADHRRARRRGRRRRVLRPRDHQRRAGRESANCSRRIAHGSGARPPPRSASRCSAASASRWPTTASAWRHVVVPRLARLGRVRAGMDGEGRHGALAQHAGRLRRRVPAHAHDRRAPRARCAPDANPRSKTAARSTRSELSPRGCGAEVASEAGRAFADDAARRGVDDVVGR